MDENKLNSILEDHYKWLLSDYKDGSRANLRGVNLRGVNLEDAENIPFIPYACPDSGSFIAYKKLGITL